MLVSCSIKKEIIGTVIDAKTGQAIEGAVVLVEWFKTEGVPGLTSTKVYKAVEAVTDNHGKFTIENVKKLLIDPPDVTVYKKGYVAWNDKYIFPDYKHRVDFKWGKTSVISLDRFEPDYLKLKPDDSNEVNIDEKIKHYKWVGNSPFNPSYSHHRHVEFIDSFIWRSGNMIKQEIEWEESIARNEKKTFISVDILCKVVDSETGQPIEAATVDSADCRKRQSTSNECQQLSDINGETHLVANAHFLVDPPFVEVYKKGYWIWNFERHFENSWDAWNHLNNGFVFQLTRCKAEDMKYENCYK